MTTRVVKSKPIDFDDLKLKTIVVVLVLLSIGLGFSIGRVVSKAEFDRAAISSGHAQYNPIYGNIEWINK